MVSLESYLRSFFISLLPYATIIEDEELEKQLTISILDINTRCNNEEKHDMKINEEIEKRNTKEEEERKKKEDDEDEFNGCDDFKGSVEEEESVVPQGENTTLHNVLFTSLNSWNVIMISSLKGMGVDNASIDREGDVESGPRLFGTEKGKDEGKSKLRESDDRHTADNSLRVTTSNASNSSSSSDRIAQKRSAGCQRAMSVSAAVVNCTVRAWLNGSYLLFSTPPSAPSSFFDPVTMKDPVPLIPWQMASILFEKDGDKEHSSDSYGCSEVSKCALLESLLGILESGPGSALLLSYPIIGDEHDVSSKALLHVKEVSDRGREKKTEFLLSMRIALCNALLPSLLTLLSSPTSLQHNAEINPTLDAGTAVHQGPSVCDVKTQFLCVRFLFSALSAVPSDRQSAFLALILPPISSYLCSVTSGMRCSSILFYSMLYYSLLFFYCSALYVPILFCSASFSTAMPCHTTPCLALPCPALPCPALPYPALLVLSHRIKNMIPDALNRF